MELDPTGLDALLEHEPGDLVCTVEAGIRLSTLQQALAPHGQRLALDPPGDPTIGACIAAALAGPLRHRFGSPRDLVLGVTLVLADGTVANAGGKVVKNVAGYDLGKLVCGSRGALALIARVSLRLHPVPAATATLVALGDPLRVVAALLDSQLEPSALDVLHPGRTAILVEGSQRAVEAQLAEARRLLERVGARVERDEAVWDESRARQAASAGTLRFAPSSLAGVLAAEREAVVRPAVGVAHVPGAVEAAPGRGVLRLREAVRHAFDPTGTLVAC
ncbi:MAG: FAD-binding protein [Thermoleophilia bacterium]|nr:FAD-binding protein [Thermoleophilia bacterium]